MLRRAGLIIWHQEAGTSPHHHEDPLLHTEWGNSSLSYAELLFNAGLLTRNPAAGDRPSEAPSGRWSKTTGPSASSPAKSGSWKIQWPCSGPPATSPVCPN